jgi:riboflavin synthase
VSDSCVRCWLMVSFFGVIAMGFCLLDQRVALELLIHYASRQSATEVSPDGPSNAKGARASITTGMHRRLTATVSTMFTGIVEEMGRVLEITRVQTDWGQGVALKISATVVLEGSGLGASISVNGCCLTLVDQGVDSDERGWWTTHVSQETLDRTVIGDLVAGSPVNLERPMQLGDRLGGHIVLGHVDGTGEVISPAPDLRIRAPRAMMKYLVEKGSVTVDGISLTAFGLTEDSFQVAVIPHTAEVTTLGTKGPGSKVNLEFDVLAKHIERLMPPASAS